MAEYRKAWAALAGGIVQAMVTAWPDLSPMSDELTTLVVATGTLFLVWLVPNAEKTDG